MFLYRPVGLEELATIYEGGMSVFPPRLPSQPIFYPVLRQTYAEEIARTWNATTPPFAGYVTGFEVDDSFASRYEVRVVGAAEHQELWVPAEELGEFNRHLTAPIALATAFFGPGFAGYVPPHFNLGGKTALEQLATLLQVLDYSGFDFIGELAANQLAVFLNYPYWLVADPSQVPLSASERARVVKAVDIAWAQAQRPALLRDSHAV